MKAIVNEYTQQFTAAEQDRIFGGNAVAFYNL
jgi:predicted TIM-barrel fold metal-dependent hydrolase